MLRVGDSYGEGVSFVQGYAKPQAGDEVEVQYTIAEPLVARIVGMRYFEYRDGRLGPHLPAIAVAMVSVRLASGREQIELRHGDIVRHAHREEAAGRFGDRTPRLRVHTSAPERPAGSRATERANQSRDQGERQDQGERVGRTARQVPAARLPRGAHCYGNGGRRGRALGADPLPAKQASVATLVDGLSQPTPAQVAGAQHCNLLPPWTPERACD